MPKVKDVVVWARMQKTPHALPSYAQFLAGLKKNMKGIPDAELKICGTLSYEMADEKNEYPYVMLRSRVILPGERILLIRCAIHGDEPAGSMTVYEHLKEIFDYARERGVKVVIFPLDNPSGFEKRTRYNMEGDSGDGGNNDFIRYEMEDGTYSGDLGTGNAFKAWHWASEPPLHIRLPKETQMLHRELKKLPVGQVRGVIDIHQDNYIVYPGAYGYAFPDTRRYARIVSEIESFTRVFKNEHIDSGYLNGPSYIATEAGQDGRIVPDEFDPVTDERGFIVRHDGTLPDLFFHLGAEHCITIETTTCSPPEVCDRVNMAWIRGTLDLIAEGE